MAAPIDYKENKHDRRDTGDVEHVKLQTRISISPEKSAVAESVEVGNSVNAFQRCADFIDANIHLFRTSITVTAAIGVLLIVRSVRVFHRFHRVSDIPEEFITKNMRLFGHFVEVKQNPVHIIVKHTPILNLPTFLARKGKDTSKGLPIHLAGIELHKGSVEFLQNTLSTNPTLRFHMLHVNHFNSLQCVVELTKWKFSLRRISLNEELLRQGLAKVVPLSGLKNQTLQTRLTQRYLAAEIQAEKKSRGLWLDDRSVTKLDAMRARLTRIKLALAPGLTLLGTIVSLPWKAVKGLMGVRRIKSGKG